MDNIYIYINYILRRNLEKVFGHNFLIFEFLMKIFCTKVYSYL
jgi:hypothetical protein